ncbi:sulfate permease, SulP family [Microbacterium sp. cf046]|uniref:SulP family inorganic anion transporter n=1 Tax=Microbacterium sp. cf046 TaxID=1761803 RepID=UPI0008E55D58|nr:SulP family inorganic anion transporter [Microbacterium sp. cf046]SFR86471.1 sulfate permease, SulP family [Microbacterium sp. cf046]
MRAALRKLFSRKTIGKDAVAGLVLGVEAVPDGLAAGLLAGINPLAGLYAYLFGMVGATFLTSSTFMAVQATGAMALIVSDSDLQSRADPDRALYTLAIMTGIVMIIAGLLGGGRLVRFVPTAVMTGFLTAVGVNIILGQLSNFTGFDSKGTNRLTKLFDLLLHVPQWSLASVTVGLLVIGLIYLFRFTPVGSLGLVIAVVLGSGLAVLLNIWLATPVLLLDDIVEVPRGLPAPVLPNIVDVPFLLLPAFSLAFVGVIQGAAVSASLPTPDGKPADTSRDFIGQGAGNIAAGFFQGMPVGGSMSGSSLIVAAGARTRLVFIIAGAVMALVILVASDLVGFVAMPALAGLLIVIGIGAIKPSRVYSVIKSGPLPTAIMAVTFGLTLVIPLQFAVLVGVGLGIILFVAQQSNRVRVRQVHVLEGGRIRESEPVPTIPAGAVVILQPYGSLFFASAPIFEHQLPVVSRESEGAVVIIRLRGTDQIGLSLIEVLRRYAHDLNDADASLKLVISEKLVLDQIESSGFAAELGEGNVYRSTEWIGETVRQAYSDALEEQRRRR